MLSSKAIPTHNVEIDCIHVLSCQEQSLIGYVDVKEHIHLLSAVPETEEF